jgi:hypothetical protein
MHDCDDLALHACLNLERRKPCIIITKLTRPTAARHAVVAATAKAEVLTLMPRTTDLTSLRTPVLA